MIIESIALVILENPVHSAIFVITLYMWYCIFDRLFVYTGFWVRKDIKARVSERVAGILFTNDTEKRDIEKIEAERLLKKNLSVIRISTVIAPMLGLLGTVWGMLITFNVISENGTGNPALMAGGISEALSSTRLGLSSAVCGIISLSLLVRMKTKLMIKTMSEEPL